MTDECFALGLLCDYLRKRFGKAARCELNAKDPPDLIATLPDESQWGVEVTRVYQQVKPPGWKKAVPTAAIEARLTRFGNKVGKMTAPVRKRDYVLHLGPGPMILLNDNTPIFTAQWMREAEEALYDHIAADRTIRLKRPGMVLEPGAEGDRWKVYPSPGGSAHIDTATFNALRRALIPKAKAACHWKSSFAQQWLLLLNDYDHADTDDVKSFIEGLARSCPELRKIDGVLWRSRLEDSLIEIPIDSS